MLITKIFEFDAAHNLINYKGKCENLHGHTYQLYVTLKGSPDENGLLIDFLDIKKVVTEKILDKLDHSNLNDTIEQPTAENIAIWAWDRLKDAFKKAELYEIKIFESKDSFVTYRGKDE